MDSKYHNTKSAIYHHTPQIAIKHFGYSSCQGDGESYYRVLGILIESESISADGFSPPHTQEPSILII